MAKAPSGGFEIPGEMRTLAEQSVDQARQAFDTFMAAAQRAASTIEGQTTAVQTSAKDIRQKAMNFAERNMAASFEFAEKLVHAKDIEEMTRLQAEFVRHQMETFTEQAKELGESTTRATMAHPGP